MYRLGELSDRQRLRAGIGLLITGAVLLAVAVWFVHYSAIPEEEFVDGEFVPVVVDYFNFVPRGCMFGGAAPCLPWKTVGYLGAFAASQMMLAGAAFTWVLNQKMTWARATVAAFLAWVELVILFGIVPSEWLNLSQTDLDWSPQKVAFTIPPWLVLGNDVQISFAALKDAISGGYHMVMLAVGAVFAYKIQDIGKPRPAAAKPEKKSPYGRPLVKGDG